MTDDVTIEISGLSRRDRANLLEHIPKDQVAFTAPPLKPGELGDPTAMVAIIALSGVAVTGMFAWLATQGVNVKAKVKGRVLGNEFDIDMVLGPKSSEQEFRGDVEKRGAKVKPA